ncbi:uncharacterized protein LOC118407506 [Branchiostoma floridae]|uniref:Uncharacterized protein LOC118407506 n=1 Tax=Branchiostoma floridae TaxID=7739 RepID=C3ZGI1_BRAFL|nr:uncharacterized protein LOC118407506 [Branchiostoma floridae]|eukprot:XP_002592351.1 hypothetical protein BRAFLDRAFT_129627 [Branchiostoma floridae]
MAPACPCVVCKKTVRPRQEALQCDNCNRWQHRTCQKEITREFYRRLVNQEAELESWQCQDCSPTAEPRNPSNSQKPVYHCPFCPYETRHGPAVLTSHLRSHLGNQHCPDCGVSAASKPALHQHIARRHTCPDTTYHGDEDNHLDEAPDACLSSCKPCRLAGRYDRRVFGHCCFLCDFSNANPQNLYRHVMTAHVQIAKSREINEPGQTQQTPTRNFSWVDDVVSPVKGNSPKSRSSYLKQEEEAKNQGDRQGTPSDEPPKTPPTTPHTMEPPHASPSALSVENDGVDFTLPLKKRRRISVESTGDENCPVTEWHTTPCEKDSKWSERLSPGSEPQLQGQNVTNGVTYDVGFCATWVPLPSLLEHVEVPLDLSVRKAPPADLTEIAMPVITSVFSWKDYL